MAIAGAAMEAAYAQGFDTVILDTAGRLHIDAPLMEELKAIRAAVEPNEILLVADAMTGQDAVAVGQSFHDLLKLTGVILTKVEGDARGGAALSMREVIGQPIKFLGVGEKLDALEVFHPERLASRILGMGDVLTLIEKAQEAFDADQVQALEKKLRQESFTLDDFREQLKQIKKMGSMEQLHGHDSGAGQQAQGYERHAAGRRGVETGGGHDQLHDARGAERPQPDQRQPPPAHRRRERHHGPGRQPAAEEFHHDPKDDQAGGQGRQEGQGPLPHEFYVTTCVGAHPCVRP